MLASAGQWVVVKVVCNIRVRSCGGKDCIEEIFVGGAMDSVKGFYNLGSRLLS